MQLRVEKMTAMKSRSVSERCGVKLFLAMQFVGTAYSVHVGESSEPSSEMMPPQPTPFPFGSTYDGPNLGDQDGLTEKHKKERSALIMFEWQIGKLKNSPGLFLQGKGVHFNEKSCGKDGAVDDFPLLAQFDEDFFDVDIDPLGRKEKGIDAIQLELTSKIMTPAEFLDRNVVDHIKKFTDKFDDESGTDRIPGSHGKVQLAKDGEEKNRLQFNFGVPIENLHKLFGKLEMKSLYDKVSEYVGKRSQGKLESTAYKALVTMAAWTAVALTKKGNGDCRHPKNYMEPYLVKTDFAEIADYVRQLVGKKNFEKFPEDVLKIAELEPDAETFPNGIEDYWKLDDLAWHAGVKPEDMPKDMKGMCKLGETLFNKTDFLNKVVNKYDCNFRHMNGSFIDIREKRWEHLRPVSPGKWLEGLMKGVNLWNDDNDALSKVAMSHTVFKSMGDWTMGYPGLVMIEKRKRRFDGLEKRPGYEMFPGIRRHLTFPVASAPPMSKKSLKLIRDVMVAMAEEMKEWDLDGAPDYNLRKEKSNKKTMGEVVNKVQLVDTDKVVDGVDVDNLEDV